MKTSKDPRHKNRQEIIKNLFAESFIKQPKKQNFTVQKILTNKNKIDKWIKVIAPEFPLEKINRVDLAILQLAVYEMIIEQAAPKKVIIDEAIELAKEFGGDSSPGFINGALGKLVREVEKNDNS